MPHVRIDSIGLALGATAALTWVLSLPAEAQVAPAPAAPPVPAAGPKPALNDPSQLPVFSKTLFYVGDYYVDRSRFDFKRMLLGALDGIQRDVPEIFIEPWPEDAPQYVRVRVNRQERNFPIARVDAMWSLRSAVKDVISFIKANLIVASAEEAARRLLDIEIRATNGMLATLDPHSMLLDVEAYAAIHTQGPPSKGGTGVVIEMDDKSSEMLIKSLTPLSPAQRAGLRPGDHLVRIDGESTANMALDEAVKRLRGDVGTSVELVVQRDASRGTKRFTLTRADIHQSSIDPPAAVLSLPGGPRQPAAKIGYCHPRHFGIGSSGEIIQALEMFDKNGVKGIILDLRGNPGGLYSEAHQVADAFIESGTLVSMLGKGATQRKDEVATKSGLEPKVPVAVLVDRASASASEIVAAAIKNLGRGVVIGEPTFGMGSTQVLFEIKEPVLPGAKPGHDTLGLKLTTAQFLAAGGGSIQGVGVIPDIQAERLLVKKTAGRPLISLYPARRRRAEAGLERRLDAAAITPRERPTETIPYLVRPSARDARSDEYVGADRRIGVGGDDQNDADEPAREPDLQGDFILGFAADFLARSKAIGRPEMLVGGRAFCDEVRAGEEQRLRNAFEALGVDWSPGRATPPPPSLQMTLQEIAGSARATAAGAELTLRGIVKNIGATPAFRVRAALYSDGPLLDERDMAFGRIGPGESKTFDLSVTVPVTMPTGADIVRATLFSQGVAIKAGVTEVALSIEGRPRPRFAIAYQTIHDQKGSNGDGQLQRGETVRTQVTVKNVGMGPATRTEVRLTSGPGQDDILITAGRFDVGTMAPGDSKTLSLLYRVRPESTAAAYQLELAVQDVALEERLATTINLAIAAPGTAPAHLTGSGQVSFPALTVSAPTVVDGDTVHIKGRAVDDHLVNDVYVRVWRWDDSPVKKVFYQPNRRAAGDRATMDFEADIPLAIGSNMVQVLARGPNDVTASQTIMIRRHATAARATRSPGPSATQRAVRGP